MTRSRTSGSSNRRRAVFAAGLLVALVLTLVLAAAASARSGRVGPEVRAAWEPGRAAEALLRDDFASHGIWDAQPTGTLVYTMTGVAPEMTLTATDASGTPVWSVAGGDVSAASGTLPAAFVAAFPDPDPNVLRDGELVAKNADGRVRFRKTFTNAFVQPLCDTTKRLVWVEVSAKAVTRVFVRQGSTTHTVALPYRPTRAGFPMFAASSAGGSRLIVGTNMPSTDRRRVMTSWLRVSRSGVPSIVSRGITDWVYVALSPSGDKAAVMTSEAVGGVGNRWVSFGRFSGRLFEGEDSGQMDVSAHRIFVQGGYTFGDGQDGWSTDMVTVLDHSPMMIYKRAWTFDDASSGIWFRHNGRIDRLAGVDDKGALTVVNVNSWAITTLPGPYEDAVPLDDGRIATMTEDGTLAFIADPVPGP
jgi:hypothetical protein